MILHKIVKGTKQEIVLCGADDIGLMYALLDVAERIGLSDLQGDLLKYVQNTNEEPYDHERAISMYTMQRAFFEQRLYDEDYWKRYFDLLAQSRFNSFVIIFGYENGGFMAPPYPYFFDLKDFPEVKLVGITPEQQDKNTASFNRLIRLAHERGIKVTAGIWDHIYRGGVQSGGLTSKQQKPEEPENGMVWGLNSKNLAEYSRASIKKFLDVFPELDGLQFRMHPESGLTEQEMPVFWHDVFNMIAETHPHLHIDIRAKELPDAIINDGLQQGLNIRVATKYWMEQMGMPFHPTHINRQNQFDRRHGYADLLTYPQRYKVHWRLWNGGTSRILLWGSPDYVRRFVASTHLYQGNSFEVNEPLATKMETQPQEKPPFELLNPKYQYYDYEFERYWYFYELFGRLGYNPKMTDELWSAQFAQHFDPVTGPEIMKALNLASGILPRIVSASYVYKYFPTTRGWAEKMHLGDLPSFATGGATDIQQFADFKEAAENILTGTEDPRQSPRETSDWFSKTADSVLYYVKLAQHNSTKKSSNEFISTVTDLNILAHLAKYHAHRDLAAVQYNLFTETQDLFALDSAIAEEKKAVNAWQNIVQSASDVYTNDLMMGICRLNMCGHWKDDLEQLQHELKKLKDQRSDFKPDTDQKFMQVAHVPVRHALPDRRIEFNASIYSKNQVDTVRCYLSENDGPFQKINMNKINEGQYNIDFTPSGIAKTISYFLEVSDRENNKLRYPVTHRQPIIINISSDTIPPRATIDKITSADVGKPLKVRATVTDASGIKWVHLRYRHVTQFEEYQSIDMRYDDHSGKYMAEIPGNFLIPKWDLMYFVETMDNAGNGRLFPDMEHEMPYVIVGLNRH